MSEALPRLGKETSRRLWVGVLVLFLYILGAFVLYASGLLAPLNIPIALYFLYRGVRVARSLVRVPWIERRAAALAQRTKRTIVLHRIWVGAGVLLLMFWYTYVSLVPNDGAVFTGQSADERAAMVLEDITAAATALDFLILSGETLLDNPALAKDDLSPSERETLVHDWNTFLYAAMLSETITDTHRYFHQISFWEERETHLQSFVIAYALYMKKFEYFHRVIDAVGTNGSVRTILNEHSPIFGGPRSYDDIADRFFASNSFLRRNMGYLYYRFFAPEEATVASGEYAALLRVARESHHYLFQNIFSHITHRSLFYTQTLDRAIGDAWMPVQKAVFVDTIGNIHVGSRKTKLITEADISDMKLHLEPGDIFVARKNWYASNLGIPGFWTHAGLYTGTIEDMRAYFQTLFPYTRKGVTYETLDALIESVSPAALSGFLVPDARGYKGSVIESETKGTSVHSIEYSAHVDYFAVMRPAELSKADVLEAILRAAAHVGKTYDYSFDQLTKDEIFCSELVYDAYQGGEGKQGVTFPTSVVTGKEIVTPIDIVRKFVDERSGGNPELSFVYFLDGQEAGGRAISASEEVFVDSYTRLKYSMFLD